MRVEGAWLPANNQSLVWGIASIELIDFVQLVLQLKQSPFSLGIRARRRKCMLVT
jgi:hypothetical protein